MKHKKIVEEFRNRFGIDPEVEVFAPGRINLIGEHVDYNGGLVMPAAVDLGIYFAMSKGSDKNVFCSVDMNEVVEVDHYDISALEDHTWANYFLGVISQMRERGYDPGPVKIVFGGDIPIGSGMSSSAAMESGFGMGLSSLFDLNISRKEMALIGQMAEHTYAGVKCGIMDQFASLFGKDEAFIQLDCLDLSYEHHPWNGKEYSLSLIDTKVKHSLADSAYNKRREECEEGLEILNRVYQKEHSTLRFYRPDEVAQARKEFSDNVFNRVEFVVEEIERVKRAAECLDKNDFIGLGELLFKSHQGLSELYEVSCEELDFLVEFARVRKGFVGARMMGGGFGGCSINIIDKNTDPAWKAEVKSLYNSEFGREPGIYEFNISDGVTVK